MVNGTITKTQPKVYRDEDFTVEYQPLDDYELSYIKVDGTWMQEMPENIMDYYAFQNIQGPHEILVVYQWKYMPYIVFGALWMLALICGIIYGFYVLYTERRRREEEMLRRRVEDRLRLQRELQKRNIDISSYGKK